jgi:hypothetical protein
MQLLSLVSSHCSQKCASGALRPTRLVGCRYTLLVAAGTKEQGATEAEQQPGPQHHM